MEMHDPRMSAPVILGILSLLFCVLFVLGLFAWFFIQFGRRSKKEHRA